MSTVKLALEIRKKAFDHFIETYLQRGFVVNSRGPTTAELYRPARFPHWLFKEQTLFVDIDEFGRIYITLA